MALGSQRSQAASAHACACPQSGKGQRAQHSAHSGMGLGSQKSQAMSSCSEAAVASSRCAMSLEKRPGMRLLVTCAAQRAQWHSMAQHSTAQHAPGEAGDEVAGDLRSTARSARISPSLGRRALFLETGSIFWD